MFTLLSVVFGFLFHFSMATTPSCQDIFVKQSQTVSQEELFSVILKNASEDVEPSLSIVVLQNRDLEQQKSEVDFLSESLDVLKSHEDVLRWSQGDSEIQRSAVLIFEFNQIDSLPAQLADHLQNEIKVNGVYADPMALSRLRDLEVPLWRIHEITAAPRRMSYEEAQAIVAAQGFLSRREFREWKDRPEGIPVKPERSYGKSGWQGWAHFLGYTPPAKIKPYDEVQASVSQLGFLFREDYRNWQNRPEGFPVDPATTYKNKGWQGWEHFLGFANFTRYKIKPYDEVQAVVSTMGFSSHLDYKAWKNRPEGFPYSPYDVYKNHGWQGWRHFLGHDPRTKPQTYVSAQAVVSKWGFANRQEFRDWKDRPPGIPAKPDVVYRDRGWKGWAHFLTPQNVKAFKDARALVQQQGFSRIKEFTYWVYKTKPEGIPLNPRSTYAKSGWLGWDDFLGTSKWMTYEEAKRVLIEAGIQSRKDFFEWPDRPLRIPTDPSKHYAEFTTWADFLENPKLRISSFVVKILPYHEAQAIVAKAGITSSKKYRDWKKPEGVPYDPQRIYLGKGWVDWPTYLGLK